MATLQLTGMSWDPKTNVSVIQHHKKKGKKRVKWWVPVRWHCPWLTVVVLRSRCTRLASRGVEPRAARGRAAENHGSHSQSGHIPRESGAHHSGSECGLAQHHAWKKTPDDSSLTPAKWLTQGCSANATISFAWLLFTNKKRKSNVQPSSGSLEVWGLDHEVQHPWLESINTCCMLFPISLSAFSVIYCPLSTFSQIFSWRAGLSLFGASTYLLRASPFTLSPPLPNHSRNHILFQWLWLLK